MHTPKGTAVGGQLALAFLHKAKSQEEAIHFMKKTRKTLLIGPQTGHGR